MLHFAGAPAEVFGYGTRTHARLETEDNACRRGSLRQRRDGSDRVEHLLRAGLRRSRSREAGDGRHRGDAIVRWQFADTDPLDASILAGMGGRASATARATQGHRHRGPPAADRDMVRAILQGTKPAVDGAEAAASGTRLRHLESMKTGRPTGSRAARRDRPAGVAGSR
jgi:hypothetical protein